MDLRNMPSSEMDAQEPEKGIPQKYEIILTWKLKLALPELVNKDLRRPRTWTSDCMIL